MTTFSFLLDADGFPVDPSVIPLREMIRFAAEFRQDHSYRLKGYRSPDNIPRGSTPVGSVELVETILLRDHGVPHVKPLQLPFPLTVPKMAVRKVFNLPNGGAVPKGDWFIKKVNRYKEAHPFRLHNDSLTLTNEAWFVSEYVEFEGEWRVFVMNDRILGVRQYSGDYTVQFNPSRIASFVNALSNYRMKVDKTIPFAYTLDIGVAPYKGRSYTMPIEMHHFYGCGLYGFEHPALPAMYSSTYYHLVRQWNR